MAGGFAGLTVWIICASLYYMLEKDNPLMMYSPAGDNPGPDDPQWNNFHNIFAAMYFSLTEFFGEFPLIDQHSTGGRFVAMFIQVVGAAVMAIPAGALGNAFSDLLEDEIGDDDDDEDKEGDGEGDGNKADDAPTVEKTEWQRCLDGETGVMMLPYTEQFGGIDAGDFCRIGVCFLSLCSVAHFILASLTTFPGNLITTVDYLYIANIIASICLAAEFIYRAKLAAGNDNLNDYLLSTVGVIDLLAVIPCLRIFDPDSKLLFATASLRILKIERFVGAFSLFWKIMCKQAAAFQATGTLAMVCWLVFSTLMYFCERDNPDPDMQRYYSSVFVSMWVTLLNLSGEVPIAQYTVTGKLLSGFMGLFGVGFVSIPMGLLGGSFEDDIDDMDEDEAEDGGKEDDKGEESGDVKLEVKKEPLKTKKSMSVMEQQDVELTLRQKVHKFLQGSADNQLEDMNPWEGRAVRFEQFVIAMIFVSAVVAALEANGPNDNGTSETFAQSLFEAFVVILFSVEYGLRYYSTPENPKWEEKGYVTDDACRFALVTSWPAIIDFLAIAPYYMSLAGSSLADKYDGQLRMLRVFRLLTLDKYIPSVSLIGRIVTNRAGQFKMAGYAMLSLWVIFAALLWLFECHDSFKVDYLRMDQRYGTVIHALPYTLVHLTGDYPLIDYTLASKCCLFVQLLFAVGVVAVPAGLLANGFQSELAAYREEQRQIQSAARSKVEQYIKSWIIRRRFRKVVFAAQEEAKRQAAEQRRVEKANSLQWRMHLFLDGLTPEGRLWSKFMMLLIVLNVLSVMLESVKWIVADTGQAFWDGFEFFSVLIFTLMYIAHIWVAPVDGACGFNRMNYIQSFWGIVDFITVAPYWLQQFMWIFGIFPYFAEHAFIFRVFRVLRILQAEDYVESFTLLDDAWFTCRDSMIACGFMALMVWVCGSVLFYNFEQGNPRMEGAFDTLPSSMYYSLIFLGGEWGLVDFTPYGQVVCVFYCIMGIALYGIPVGAVFEAFGSVLEERNAIAAAQEEKDKAAEDNTGDAGPLSGPKADGA